VHFSDFKKQGFSVFSGWNFAEKRQILTFFCEKPFGMGDLEGQHK